jgi:uncharacterized membrane protein
MLAIMQKSQAHTSNSSRIRELLADYAVALSFFSFGLFLIYLSVVIGFGVWILFPFGILAIAAGIVSVILMQFVHRPCCS